MSKSKKIGVTVIITNRNCDMIDYVIKNFEETYPEISFQFIVISQEDNTLFKKGQLYNIAFKYVETDYLMLLDNDFINLSKIDFIDIYEKNLKPMILFTSISQCYIKNDIPTVVSTAVRKTGFGGCIIMKTQDFIDFGGFSNLCIAWGYEDNIFGIKSSCGRLDDHIFGHIMHPHRNMNINQGSQENNKQIYLLYKSHKIDYQEDGYKQTIGEVVFDNKDKNVRKIGITNIGVTDDYKYIDLYKKMEKIDKKETELIKKEDKGVSICISAYNSADTIKRTLDSIITQSWFRAHNNWEIIVGIDGCEKTLEYMKTIMNNYKNLRVFMMDSNKGTYITCNTIMSQIAKYDYIVRFDADDEMKENYIESMMKSPEGDIYRFYFKYKEGTGRFKSEALSMGQHGIKKDVFLKFGGYRPWLCAADWEMLTRLEKFVKQRYVTNTMLIKYDIPNSLMNAELTRYPGAPLRQKYHSFIEKEKENLNKEEDAIIEMETNTYKEVTSDIYEYNQSSYMCFINPKLSVPEVNIPNNINTPTKKVVKRNPAYSPVSGGNVQRATTVKIISKPVKRIVIASKVNII